MKHKECYRCKKTKPLTNYSECTALPDGYYQLCDDCRFASYLPWEKKPPEWRWGHVYLFKAEDLPLYKIGFTSRNPGERLYEISANSPVEVYHVASLESPAANVLEWELHVECQEHHRRGEWYELPDELVERIKSAIEVANAMKAEAKELGF